MNLNSKMEKQEIELQNFETKVDEVLNILEALATDNVTVQENGLKRADKFLGNDKTNLDNIDEFIVRVKHDRTVISKNIDSDPSTKDKNVFMAEVERDAAKRAADRRERTSAAQNLRKLGNIAFRDGEYEKAISIYNKAIDQVRDSPILYNNRALCYIKLQMHKRAIIDCDFVLNKLDEKNIRSWIYRAKSYFLLGETKNYEKSLAEVKKHNPKELPFIEKMQEKISNNEI